jgi:L,D-transpeptidase ErfK/SrfK
MSTFNRSAFSTIAASFAFTAAGCVFVVPPQDQLAESSVVAEIPMPDRQAPRLEPLETRHFDRVRESAETLGRVQVMFTRYENTFTAIAREYNIGYDALRRANPSVDHWLPGDETPVYLPTHSILPDAPRDGILINLPSMRLYYFERRGESVDGERELSVTMHPIGIGREGWATPTGEASVTEKVVDPTWYPPASVRRDHAERGDPLPAVVPPGPDNPLGRHAMTLSLPGYLIHGTNRPAGVGMRVSAGCIRMYPEDIEALFGRVPRGTKVRIVDEPVLAGWHDGELYLEVHQPLDEDERDLAEEAVRVIAAALERAGVAGFELDSAAIARIVDEQRGIPFPVGVAAKKPPHYLAASRVVENTVRVPRSETAAAFD